MKRSSLILILTPLAVISCARERHPTGQASPQLYGTLAVPLVDSFHLSDLTANWSAEVKYYLSETRVPFDSGSYTITPGSQVGDVHRATVDHVPSGGLIVTVNTVRPFVIMTRKDDVSRARFGETMSVVIPPYSRGESQALEIWAYHPYRLVVYFDRDVIQAQADSIVDGIGARVISRQRSFLDGDLFYYISTETAGYEDQFKPVLENTAGVRNVYFDIFGHSYF